MCLYGEYVLEVIIYNLIRGQAYSYLQHTAVMPMGFQPDTNQIIYHLLVPSASHSLVFCSSMPQCRHLSKTKKLVLAEQDCLPCAPCSTDSFGCQRILTATRSLMTYSVSRLTLQNFSCAARAGTWGVHGCCPRITNSFPLFHLLGNHSAPMTDIVFEVLV